MSTKKPKATLSGTFGTGLCHSMNHSEPKVKRTSPVSPVSDCQCGADSVISVISCRQFSE